MTSSGALAILITRALLLFGFAASVIFAPQYRVLFFIVCICLVVLLQRITRVPLVQTHRHIYFAVSAISFSTICLLLVLMVARRGSTWWLLAALTLFCGGMVFSMARSIYGPHTKV